MVQALLSGDAYPEKPRHVEVIQTHLSFVFITDGLLVYKIKKPVSFGFVDFSTLDKRRYYCYQEVALNQRLCPDIYLGVVQIAREGDSYFVEGPGQPVEYAVRMRKLPLEQSLDKILDRNQANAEMMKLIAKKLVAFHDRSRCDDEILRFGGIPTVAKNTGENFEETERYIGISIEKRTFDRIKTYTQDFLATRGSLFQRRIDQRRIKDCHGDLHSAHICFGNDVYIFDCIEFNDRFRYCDVASEIAFLAMDLDYHGQPELSHVFVDIYVNLSGDQELLELLNFYKCYRAYVRGKVESFKLDDPHVSEEEKTRGLAVARKYFELADQYAAS